MTEFMTGQSRTAARIAGDVVGTVREHTGLHVDLRELQHEEALDLLKLHHVGLVGISFHDLVRIKLCNYIYSEGWIYIRTELDHNLVMTRHHPWAAFEVHEAESVYDWRSLEIFGAVEFLSSDMQSGDWFRFEAGVRLLRAAIPQILTAEDPMPQRVQLLRIHVDTIHGRESKSGSPQTLPAP